VNCREFEQLWDDLLDARSEISSEFEPSLEAHASGCSRCRAISDRYQLLRQAIAKLRPPTPSAGSIERLHALTLPSDPVPISIPIRTARPRSGLQRSLVAAASFALVWLGANGWLAREPRESAESGPPTVVPVAPTGRLSLALAEATEATLDLAREASAPASRIGHDMIAMRELAPATTEPTDAAGTVDEPATGLLKAVGDRVGAGVGPISGSARHAFSFLLGPAGEPEPATSR